MMGSKFPKIIENDFHLPKHGDSLGKYYLPAMSDAPLRGYKGRHEWFWEPGDDDYLFPVDALVTMYEKSVGRNSTLILGLTPDTAGLIPAPDVERLKEFGEAVTKKYGKPIGLAAGGLEIDLRGSKQINAVMIGEDIALGHRIKNFRVKAFMRGRWTDIASGTAVGNKFIGVLPVPVTASKVKLVIDDSFAPPAVKSFAVY